LIFFFIALEKYVFGCILREITNHIGTKGESSMKTKYVTLLWALKKLGCRDIKLKTNWSCSYRPVQRGTFVGGGENGFADGQLYYIEFEPMHGFYPQVHFTDVKDADGNTKYVPDKNFVGRKDTEFESKLARIGYELKRTITKRKERKDKKHAEKPHPVVCD